MQASDSAPPESEDGGMPGVKIMTRSHGITTFV
jgi:hypothetical protein